MAGAMIEGGFVTGLAIGGLLVEIVVVIAAVVGLTFSRTVVVPTWHSCSLKQTF